MVDDINDDRRRFLGVAAMSIGAASLGTTGSLIERMMPGAVQTLIDGELASLRTANEWLNSPPLTAAGLRGKVVLIDF